MSAAGLISGTPANTGSWRFAVRVSDSDGASFTRTLTLFVNSNTASTLNITNAAVISDASIGTVRSLVLTATGGTGTISWSVEAGSTLPPGLSLLEGSQLGLPAGTTVLGGRVTALGDFEFTLQARDTLENFGNKTFTLHVSPMQVLSASLPAARAGVPYTNTFTVMGGTAPYTFALALGNLLPTGITLSSNGVLSGTTGITGRFTFAMTVTDAAGASLTKGFQLTVLGASQNPPLTIRTTSTPEASRGVPYWVRLDSLLNGGVAPFSWNLASGSSLPQGLNLVRGNSVGGDYLLGSPTLPGAYTYPLTVTDAAGQSASGSFTTLVSLLGLSPDPLPIGTAGSAMSIELRPSGGVAPYNSQLFVLSGLPAGMSLNAGTLSGTPASPGQFRGQIVVTDNTGATLNRGYILNIDSPSTPIPFLSVSPRVEFTYTKSLPPPVVPFSIASSSGTLNFTAAISGLSGVGLSATGGTTPATFNLVLDAPTLNSMSFGNHYGVIAVSAPDSPTGLQSIPVVMHVAAAVNAPPVLHTINPNFGSPGLPVSVTLTGANFVPGATSVTVSGNGVAVSDVTVTSPETLTAVLAIDASAAFGYRQVTVTTPKGSSGGRTFTVMLQLSVPTLTAVSPKAGVPGESVQITLTGSNFMPGLTSIVIDGEGVTVGNVHATSTTVTATLTIDPTASLGDRKLKVKTPPGTSNAVIFSVISSVPTPVLHAISPNAAAAGTSVNVTLHGMNFVPSLTSIVVSGTGVTVSNVNATDTTVTATLEIDSAAPLGYRQVAVTVPGDASGTALMSNTRTFTILPAATQP